MHLKKQNKELERKARKRKNDKIAAYARYQWRALCCDGEKVVLRSVEMLTEPFDPSTFKEEIWCICREICEASLQLSVNVNSNTVRRGKREHRNLSGAYKRKNGFSNDANTLSLTYVTTEAD